MFVVCSLYVSCMFLVCSLLVPVALTCWLQSLAFLPPPPLFCCSLSFAAPSQAHVSYSQREIAQGILAQATNLSFETARTCLLEPILTSQFSTPTGSAAGGSEGSEGSEGSAGKKEKKETVLATIQDEIIKYPNNKNDKDKPMYILEQCLDGDRWELVSAHL